MRRPIDPALPHQLTAAVWGDVDLVDLCYPVGID